MSHGRLATLLRTFRLEPGATTAQLRQAYLSEAKRLHPDANVKGDSAKAAKEFADLRERFEEASALLSGKGSSQAGGYGGRWDGAGHAEQAAAGAWNTSRWETGRSSYRSTRQQWPPRDTWQSTGSSSTRDGVPVVGFPARTVYMLTGTLTVVIGGLYLFLFARSRQSEPNRLTMTPHIRGSRETEEQNSLRLRKALEEQPAATVRGFTGSESEGDSASDQVQDPGSQLQDASGYYKARARRATFQRAPADDGKVSPQTRLGVALSPAHVAAQDDRVWWLERCGASSDCFEVLEVRDRRGDAPLHHCAQSGSPAACYALLRSGVDAATRNKWNLWPEDLAAHEGYSELAQVLRTVRLAGSSHPSSSSSWRRHADGLGILDEDSSFFERRYPSESLRHALNLAAGRTVLRRLQVDRAIQQNATDRQEVEPVTAALKLLFGALAGTGVILDEEQLGPGTLPNGADWWKRRDGAEVALLVFEPPGKVTPDSPGHWIAVRKSSKPDGEEVSAEDPGSFVRLDPVRGAFKLTGKEMRQLLDRYRVWRVTITREGQRADADTDFV